MKYIRTFESFSINESKYELTTQTEIPMSGWLVIENPSEKSVDDLTIENIYKYFGLQPGSKTNNILDIVSSSEPKTNGMGEWSGDLGAIRLNKDNESIKLALEDQNKALKDIGNLLGSKVTPRSYPINRSAPQTIKQRIQTPDKKSFRFTGIGNV